AIQFVPVVLRRLGAGSELLALYTAQTYLGSILTSFSIVLMRRRRTKSFAVWCWLAARSLFLLFAVITQAWWMLLVTAIFWLLEAFPSPAYTRMMQAIYPEGVRGQAMSLVRLGMTAAIVLVTPLAGWALDHWGYQVLFPLAALMGILATWFFNRLEVDEGALPPRQTRSLRSLWAVVLSNRNFAIHLTAFAVYGVGALAGYALYPIVQVDRLHLSYTELGLLGTAQSIAWLLGFVYWGQAVDRRGGLWVLRLNLAIGFLVPFSYIWATEGWMLLPAFIAQGIISAGVDLGLLNTCIQLADPDQVVEYAAIQATVVGLRGIVAPFIGVALTAVGVSETAIFAAGSALIVLSWFILGRVQIELTPEQMRAKRQQLRFRWPIRFRFPRM
ncbi:MAG TPA: MFS transporter, partial [Caldilineaceae bacterium]|nr:MFS transporter [Caldilineaceae bacterium]